MLTDCNTTIIEDSYRGNSHIIEAFDNVYIINVFKSAYIQRRNIIKLWATWPLLAALCTKTDVAHYKQHALVVGLTDFCAIFDLFPGTTDFS